MDNISGRIRSIDAFRAVTMLLMIFVNDMDSMQHIPKWIQHADETDDALGFADIIFPAFLFIVGLSIPFAFQKRASHGDNRIPLRIITRSFLLILAGFFLANVDIYNTKSALLSRPVWESLMIISFFFIMLDYRKEASAWGRYLQGFGILLLGILSAIYKSNDPVHPWLHFTWWEILGLIGWSYLVCAFIYHWSKGSVWIQVIAWLFFVLFNLDFHAGWLDFLEPVSKHVWIAGNGAMQAFTMAGVSVAVLYIHLEEKKNLKLFFTGMIVTAVILLNIGFIVRDITGGISKSNDSPAWVLICTAICLVVYAAFVFIVDIRGKYNWFKFAEPAGAGAFTCYMVAALYYPLHVLARLDLPEYLDEGTGGLIKALIFAFAVVWVTALLKKINIRLKI